MIHKIKLQLIQITSVLIIICSSLSCIATIDNPNININVTTTENSPNFKPKSANISTDPYKILFLLDDNFGITCLEIMNKFSSYGWEIETAATKLDITGCSTNYYKKMQVDRVIDDINYQDYQCISILPGKTHNNLKTSDEFKQLIQMAVKNNIVVATWCKAGFLLAEADVIQGRNVTGRFEDQREIYEAAGANFFLCSPPIADGNIITSVRTSYYQEETCELIKSTVELYDQLFVSFSSYLGGSGDEEGTSANLKHLADTAFDSQGNLIVLGRTQSNDFPVLNSYQPSFLGNIDITISKYNSTGGLIFSTFFGGTGTEWGVGIEIDADDNIIFSGTTNSKDFPLKNAYQSQLLGGREGNYDAFLVKLSGDGQQVLFSTYFGGTDTDFCYTLALDNMNNILLAGTTWSSDLPKVNATQDTLGGSWDAFITKFSNDGQSIIFSTLYGGSSADSGRGIGIDQQNNVYLTGEVSSPNLEYGTVLQSTYLGQKDAFLMKFSPEGERQFFTYLGGTSIDRGTALTIDENNDIIIAGYTHSSDFPMKNSFQSKINGIFDAFVTKIDSTGKKILGSTFLGGTEIDKAHAITLDENQNIIITGESNSQDFPTTQSTADYGPRGNTDIFVSQLDGNCKKLYFSILIGGTDDDLAVAAKTSLNSSLAMVGFTYSSDFPTKHPNQKEYGGNCDLFVMQITIHEFLSQNSSSSIPSYQPIQIGSIAIFAMLYLFIRKKICRKKFS